MKRSEINAYIKDAEGRYEAAGFKLPEWAHWNIDQWRANADRYAEIAISGLGWDLTDFGLGEYEKKGLLLFTVRNGANSVANPLPYAEKLMVVLERQVTPMHFHWSKTEDIINRGGGELMIRLQMADKTSERLSEEPFTVYRDGVRTACRPGEEIRLTPGQSITLYPWLYHSFWAENGDCIVGEVSSVNDDATDNRFLDPVGRFPAIEEDEPRYRLLCTEYERVFVS